MGSASYRSMKNGIIAILVPLPSIIFYLSFQYQYPSSWSTVWTWCYDHPLLLANVIFFLNVNLLFWVIALIQSSHWMIGPYWTVIPVMFVHYYSSHPLGEYEWLRSRVVKLLTWVWSIRLIHNYLRREKWQLGGREDWRFSDLRHQYGKHWWWASFFAIYIPHQIFLFGLSLPFYVIHTDTLKHPLTIWDLLAMLICLSGIVTAYIADNQLYKFVGTGVLEKGLWYYCRHPNYFGEQVWWWGLSMFAWNLGHGWACIGAIANTMCLAYVTKLVEDRMLKHDTRAEAFRLYQNTTSLWFPCFKFSPSNSKNA